MSTSKINLEMMSAKPWQQAHTPLHQAIALILMRFTSEGSCFGKEMPSGRKCFDSSAPTWYIGISQPACSSSSSLEGRVFVKEVLTWLSVARRYRREDCHVALVPRSYAFERGSHLSVRHNPLRHISWHRSPEWCDCTNRFLRHKHKKPCPYHPAAASRRQQAMKCATN